MAEANQDIKIMLIEDNHTDYLLTSKILSTLYSGKIELDWSKSYDEGLKAIGAKQHDIYLIDYSLGTKNGLDLVQESREIDNTTGPFILLTDFDATQLFERSLELGIYDHIKKSELSPSVADRTLRYSIRRYQTEQALKQEKEFNSFILAEIPYLIISVDQAGLISSVNPATTQLFKCNEEALISKNWKDLIHDDDRDDIKYKVSDDGEVSFEARVITSDDEERVINWNILNKGLSREGTELTAFILSGKDVTSQVKAEEVERRRQKMEALGQLAGGVAHEINNLLQPILMSSQMVASRAENSEDSEDRDYLIKNMERIERNTKNAAKIVDDILLFSRGEQKEIERVNLYQALQDSVIFVKEMLPATIGIITNFEDDADKQKADINPNELTQIVTNMLINASHAMSDQGDIHISIKNRDLSIEESSIMNLRQDTYAEINITDTGYGISEENQANIFNPFFTTKDVGEGTGLGLSIVYNIIEKWGGTIKVKSKPKKGTTFSIYIPMK